MCYGHKPSASLAPEHTFLKYFHPCFWTSRSNKQIHIQVDGATSKPLGHRPSHSSALTDGQSGRPQGICGGRRWKKGTYPIQEPSLSPLLFGRNRGERFFSCNVYTMELKFQGCSRLFCLLYHRRSYATVYQPPKTTKNLTSSAAKRFNKQRFKQIISTIRWCWGLWGSYINFRIVLWQTKTFYFIRTYQFKLQESPFISLYHIQVYPKHSPSTSRTNE